MQTSLLSLIFICLRSLSFGTTENEEKDQDGTEHCGDKQQRHKNLPTVTIQSKSQYDASCGSSELPNDSEDPTGETDGFGRDILSNTDPHQSFGSTSADPNEKESSCHDHSLGSGAMRRGERREEGEAHRVGELLSWSKRDERDEEEGRDHHESIDKRGNVSSLRKKRIRGNTRGETADHATDLWA
jgi:hypothetical protein